MIQLHLYPAIFPFCKLIYGLTIRELEAVQVPWFHNITPPMHVITSSGQSTLPFTPHGADMICTLVAQLHESEGKRKGEGRNPDCHATAACFLPHANNNVNVKRTAGQASESIAIQYHS